MLSWRGRLEDCRVSCGLTVEAVAGVVEISLLRLRVLCNVGERHGGSLAGVCRVSAWGGSGVESLTPWAATCIPRLLRTSWFIAQGVGLTATCVRLNAPSLHYTDYTFTRKVVYSLGSILHSLTREQTHDSQHLFPPPLTS